MDVRNTLLERHVASDSCPQTPDLVHIIETLAQRSGQFNMGMSPLSDYRTRIRIGTAGSR